MRVCAEFEDQFTALGAHKHLVDGGCDPNDVEIRSPYPLSEVPMPAHRSSPMWMRYVVRFCWACGLTFGFLFISYTQFEWGPVAVTDGHPLIPPPITMIPTYECGMITAILTTTFMFFLETFRYRRLVPPIEEDLPVGIGYVVVIVAGASAEKALKLLEGRGARSVVTYGLMLLLLGSLTGGCARNNMREQDVYKTTEASAEFPPEHSLRMSNAQDVQAPAPFRSLYLGDVELYAKVLGTTAKILGLNVKKFDTKDEAQKKALDGEMDQLRPKIKEFTDQLTAEDGTPTLYTLKALGAPPAEMAEWKNPLSGNEESAKRGEHLYQINCSACHGEKGDGNGKVGEVEAVKPWPIGTANYKDKSDGYLYYFIATGKNAMPPMGYRLSPGDICDILNHLRALQAKS